MDGTKERYDYFMIWGNGLHHADLILSSLRRHPAFVILAMYRIDVKEPMRSFVDKVYSCDRVPLEHLAGKTRYLKEAPSKIVLVIVKNKYVVERMFGEGDFRHIQCATVKAFKEHIRNRFNPRDDFGRRTEEHVIHGSDYESQVDHTLSVLGLPKKEFFDRCPNPDIECSSFLNDFEYEDRIVSIDDMQVDLVTNVKVPVNMSPHYRFLLGDEKPYRDYWEDNWGFTLLEDHSPESFKSLVSRYKYDEGSRHKVVLLDVGGGKYVIRDGAHRVSILLFHGFDKIRCAVMTRW